MWVFCLIFTTDCVIGDDGWRLLISTFLDNTNIVLKELHLAGNNIGCEQINYLMNQLNVEETSASNHFIFQSLRILNLNGGVALWV